ncbi:hypothetical protein ACFQFC_18080 [Amorphoplanes digitatis]|uniref:Uncharacterized protein n=1 Tax=Actinoplanes digitatis TaxID=1868 RepID=A0A7W7I470_9ACTN|nr:hypothetical protein [Actinoplanes digitatis]MBB4766123.1 hypothetical protein [Actinoplanes digitatis]BFE76127.1 hypothetical protein GCM10020092_094280 [Actinoplanes digitatis]GID96547.1 hypothetical protein Adi01nite_59590 [Actinoplanes digitatis]
MNGADLARAGRLIYEIVVEFTDEMAGPPTLAELLEIISSGMADGGHPPKLDAVLRDGRRPAKSGRPSRAGDLNDAVFVLAANLLAGLTSASDGRPDTVSAALVTALHDAGVILADATAEDVTAITTASRQPSRKYRIGDLVALQATGGGFHVAVVAARNRFGTAIAVVKGVQPTDAAPAGPVVIERNYYTDDQGLHDGGWFLLGHDDSLIPAAEPEFYYAPVPWDPDEAGEYGLAESPGGATRLLSAEEAAAVGVDQPGFTQVWGEKELADHLNSRRTG